MQRDWFLANCIPRRSVTPPRFYNDSREPNREEEGFNRLYLNLRLGRISWDYESDNMLAINDERADSDSRATDKKHFAMAQSWLDEALGLDSRDMFFNPRDYCYDAQCYLDFEAMAEVEDDLICENAPCPCSEIPQSSIEVVGQEWFTESASELVGFGGLQPCEEFSAGYRFIDGSWTEHNYVISKFSEVPGDDSVKLCTVQKTYKPGDS